MLAHVDVLVIARTSLDTTITISIIFQFETLCTSHIYRSIVGTLMWASQVHPEHFITKHHTRHLSLPTEWEWTHFKHTFKYIKRTMHYKFFTSSRLSQTHSPPFRQLMPLNINTCCDNDWIIDIDSTKSMSSIITSIFQILLAFNTTEYNRYIISRNRT